MDKVLLEYEKCQCTKIEKEVTLTSMVIEESSPAETPCLNAKQAFDCNQKKACGVLFILGNKGRVDWAECTHPKLTEISKTTDALTRSR